MLALLGLVLGFFLAGAPAWAETSPLRWGIDLEGGGPYALQDPRDPSRIIGYEKEIADQLALRLGQPVTLVQVAQESLIPALKRGTIDFAMSGLEITQEHKRGALFSRPYYLYREQIVVRRDETRIKGLEDLKARKVGTISASQAARMLDQLGTVDSKPYSDMYAIYKDLAFGRIDAIFIDVPIARYYGKGNEAIRFVEPPLGEGYYGIALRLGDNALKQRIDAAIEGMMADGTLQRILQKWEMWDERQASIRHLLDPADAPREEGLSWGRYLPVLLKGAATTVKIAVVAMALAMGAGLGLALLRLYGPAPARWFAQGYVEIMRGTPLLIQLYLIYYGLPNLGIQLDAYVAGVLGLGLNYAANEAENYRAGLQAVPKGQTEASLALGMSRLQVLRHVVVPQSLKVTIPPVTNDFIALFKDSSLVSVITLVELTKAYGMLASATYDYIRLGLVTAAIYLIISYPASLLARYTEARLRRA